MSTLSKLKYPYRWGAGIVNGFVEKYARGTFFLARILDVSPGEVRHALVIVLCRGNSIRFESLKRVIKNLDTMESRDIARFSAEERKLLYRYYLYLAQDDAIDREIERKALDMGQNNFLNL